MVSRLRFAVTRHQKETIHFLLTCYFDILRCFTTRVKKSTWQPPCWKPCCCQASLKYHLPTTCWAQLRPNLSPQHMLHHSNPVVSGFLWPYLWPVDTPLEQAIGNPLEMQWEVGIPWTLICLSLQCHLLSCSNNPLPLCWRKQELLTAH